MVLNNLSAIDIRNGRLTTEHGRKQNELHDGKRPKSLDLFLDFLDISEDEFYEILKTHEVSPWQFDKLKLKEGEPLPDMGKWDTTR